MTYQSLLEESVPAAFELNVPEFQQALSQFIDFFANMTPERTAERVDSVYAKNAILYDTLCCHRGIGSIRKYFIKTAERASGVRVEILDTVRSGKETYIKWSMEIDWSAFKKGKTTQSVGMTHLRFNTEGKVVFHYDFWDSTNGFFEHLPLIGFLIRFVKRKVAND